MDHYVYVAIDPLCVRVSVRNASMAGSFAIPRTVYALRVRTSNRGCGSSTFNVSVPNIDNRPIRAFRKQWCVWTFTTMSRSSVGSTQILTTVVTVSAATTAVTSTSMQSVTVSTSASISGGAPSDNTGAPSDSTIVLWAVTSALGAFTLSFWIFLWFRWKKLRRCMKSSSESSSRDKLP